MEAKLIIDGKEFPIEIQDSELQKLLASRKTGYERVDESQKYWYQASSGNVERKSNMRDNVDAMYYSNANYYSDETIARNNARADNLMRQLRRFAVEHRNKKMNWANEGMRKYYIYTICGTDELTCDSHIQVNLRDLKPQNIMLLHRQFYLYIVYTFLNL